MDEMKRLANDFFICRELEGGRGGGVCSVLDDRGCEILKFVPLGGAAMRA